MYTCTCLDAILHATICKHVHLVSSGTNDNRPSEPTVLCNHDNDYAYFDNVLFSGIKPTDQLISSKNKCYTLMKDLQNEITACNDIDTRNTVTKHITSALALESYAESTTVQLVCQAESLT